MPAINSLDDAQSIARLIQTGQLTGDARDTAMQDLRDFHDSQGAPQPAASQASAQPTGGILRDIALAGRAVGEGVTGAFALPHDLGIGMGNLMARGVNGLFGTHIPMEQTWSQGFSNALTASGAPVPQTSMEQLGTAGLRGLSGAVTGGGLLGLAEPALATVPNTVRAGAAGLVGGGASETARQAGLPASGQFIAGLLGGVTPAAVEGLAGTALPSLIRPLTRAGQQQIASNVLARNATNPNAAARNLSTAEPIVPGSPRTVGEASQDPGLLALEKGVRSKNPGAFAELTSAQNTARQAELTALGGTSADIGAAQSARNAATAPMRETALSNPVGSTIGAPTSIVHDTIDSLLASPAGSRESVSRTLGWARDLIGDETNPAALYEIRKDLQLAQQGKLQPSSPNAPNASTLAQARGQLGQVIGSLDNAIEYAAPGFKDYLARYRELSIPINQQAAIQEIQRRAQTSQTDIASGQPFLGNVPFGRALDSAIQKNSNLFTPEQARRLAAIRTDLQMSSATSSPLVRAPGSDTFQNVSIAQVLGSGFSPGGLHPIARVLTTPLGWVYRMAGTDEGINQALAQAMLDPKLAAQMLQRATPQSVQTFSNQLRYAARKSLPNGGMVSALSATQPTYQGAPSGATASGWR